MEKKSFNTDFLVIGTGIAGLTFAINAATIGKVIIISKSKAIETSTDLAQGGIAAVIPGTDDSISLHIEDTLRTGVGLCKPYIVEKVISYAPEVISKLTKLGVKFSHNEGSSRNDFNCGLEGGHSRNRIVHIADYTGHAIEKTLLEKIYQNPNIELLEYHFAIDLLTQHHLPNYPIKPWENIECYGAYALDTKNEIVKTIIAKKTLLATGSAGVLYQHTTCPSVATGDGFAMAYRAGARIANMEMMQFHPTVLYNPNESKPTDFLISEAVRGDGGILYNIKHEKFMKKYTELGELGPRDIVARAIDQELKATGERFVYLEIRHKGKQYIKKRFPYIYQSCLNRGLDITKEMIPVVPAAHYICGGVIVDEHGRTDIENLYACGEVAHTGFHGANRLASNSLLEAFAFADFCFKHVKRIDLSSEKMPIIPDWDDSGVFDRGEWVIIKHNYKVLRALMWDYMGIVRSISRLERALTRVRFMWEEIEDFYRKNPVRRKILELRNMAYVAELMIRSALFRHESRGLHYLKDYPNIDTRFARDTILKSTGLYNETHLS